MYSESLTLRILADSSELDSSLGQLSRKLGDLQSSTDRLAGTASRLGGAFQMTSALNSIERLSRSLTGVLRQIQQIAGTPLTINVDPALAAIASVSRALSQLASQIATLPTSSGIGYLPLGTGIGTGGGMATGGSSPSFTSTTQRFATGGLVTGPAGIDRIPALLTAGEYVLTPDIVQKLGLGTLQQWQTSSPTPTPRALTGHPAANISHHQSIGEMHVHVERTLDLETLTNTLAQDAQRLRNRRG
jgi:hypothetical protein